MTVETAFNRKPLSFGSSVPESQILRHFCKAAGAALWSFLGLGDAWNYKE
jgi:hypothetical protein